MASKATIDAFSIILPAIPTMAPFLYRTRTLTSFQWARALFIRPKVCRRHSRRYFSGGKILYVDSSNGVEATTTRATPEENRGPTIRRTSVMHGSEPKFSGNFYGKENGSRSLADQPRKQLSTTKNAYRLEYTKRHADMSWDTNEVLDNDFEDLESNELYEGEDEVFENNYEDDAWTRISESSHDRDTTITPSEREAFEAIFKNIHNKMKNAQRYDGFAEELVDTAASGRAGGIPKEGTGKKGTYASLENIMGNALSANVPRTRDEKEIIVNRYPPSLRALAAKAVGLDFDESHYEAATKEEEESLDSDQLEELRKPLREGVEAKMHAAKTDIELWAVMEQEVFPLIAKLGLEGTERSKLAPKKPSKKTRAPSKEPKTLKTKASRLSLSSEEEQVTQLEPILHEGQVVSPLTLYGPLYPSYLLLGLRLLDRSFAKPSPLTISILPKIKSLGLISHVLGASTQLYNELLIIYWYRNDDFRGALTLLSEMEQFGLTFDGKTLDIVEDIRNMQIRILRGDRGETLQMLWSLPEFAPGKFGPWSKKIQRILKERNEGRLAY